MARLLGVGLVAALLLVSVAAYGADVTVNGYVQYQFSVKEGADPSSNFSLAAARLKGSMKVTDKISAMAQLEGCKSVSLLEADVTYSHAPFLNLKLGQFQVPFGYETQNSNFDVEAGDRSQVVGALWDNGTTRGYYRDAGAMVFGRHKILVYQLACVNGSGLNTSDNNNHKDFVGRVGVGIPMFAGLGFSMLQGKGGPQDSLSDRTGIGFDIFLDTGKVLFQAEYITAEGTNQYDKDEDLWCGSDTEFGGYYVTVGYRITPLIEPVFKYDKFDPDKDVDDDEVSAMYLGLNLNFEGKARLQAFYTAYDEDEDIDNNKFTVIAKAKF